MKHIKTFEDLNKDIEIGDWVSIRKDLDFIDDYKYLLYMPWKIINTYYDNQVLSLINDKNMKFDTHTHMILITSQIIKKMLMLSYKQENIIYKNEAHKNF